MDGVDGEYRTRLFHAIRDLTADSYGGWRQVTNIQAGGGLYAQRIVTRKHYDLDGAKQAALRGRRPRRGRATDALTPEPAGVGPDARAHADRVVDRGRLRGSGRRG